MHGSGAFEKLPHSVMRLLIERVVSYGITLTRTSNCWNDFQELKEELHQLREVGMETIVNLIYSVSRVTPMPTMPKKPGRQLPFALIGSASKTWAACSRRNARAS